MLWFQASIILFPMRLSGEMLQINFVCSNIAVFQFAFITAFQIYAYP